jgi:hypothetical protein
MTDTKQEALKARVFVIYNGDTANPRIVKFNGLDIPYAENVKVIEYSAYEQIRSELEAVKAKRELIKQGTETILTDLGKKITELENQISDGFNKFSNQLVICQKLEQENEKLKEFKHRFGKELLSPKFAQIKELESQLAIAEKKLEKARLFIVDFANLSFKKDSQIAKDFLHDYDSEIASVGKGSGV